MGTEIYLYYFFTATLIFITLLLSYAKKSTSYWKRRNVPYLEPSLLFGNLDNPITNEKSQAEYYKEFYFKFKEMRKQYGGIYMYGFPAFMTIDPLYNKYILVKNFQNFQHRGFYNNEKHQPASANLFTKDGDKWRTLRMKFTPTFTSAKMKIMLNLMVDATKVMEKYVEQHVIKKIPLNTRDCVSCFTADVIGSCAFGVECNSFKDTTLLNTLTEMFEGSTEFIKVSFCMALPKLANFLRIPLFPWKATKYICDSISHTIKQRIEKNISRNDFLQMVMEMKDENIIDMDELYAQCILFFIAGYETSATTLTFLLFELAYNQEIQNKLRREIKEVLAKYNGEICYESIKNMKYLEMVISETLRKYSPFPILNRKCAEDFALPNSDIIIEKGTLVVIPIIGFHNDPEYFPNPEKFDPERFSEANKSNINPYTYMPFGVGPRNCLGDRFGKQQVQTGTISLLRKYIFRLNPQVKLPLELKPTFFPDAKQAILLDLERVPE